MLLAEAIFLVMVITADSSDNREVYCPCYIDSETDMVDCSSRNLVELPECVPNTTKQLNLATNDLRYHPKQFQRLESLHYLDLSANYQFNPESDSFFGLSELRILYLNNTDYLYLKQNAFDGLTQLQTLSLQGSQNVRQYLVLPEGLFDHVQSLTYLIISYKIIKINDFQFANLCNLVSLDISHSVISAINEHTFSGLSSLIEMSLADSDWFTNETPPNVFKSLIALEELHIEGFCFDNFRNCSRIDSIFKDVSTLKRLYIHNSILVYTLGTGFFALDTLEELFIVDSDDLLFEPRCNLDFFDQETFRYLRKAPILKLAIHNCDVDFIRPNTFAHFKDLESVDVILTSRWCHEIYDNFGRGMVNTKIQKVRLSVQCQFHWEFSHAPILYGIENTVLERLDLSNGPTEVIDQHIMSHLPKTLTHLYINKNKARTFDIKSFKGFNKLMVLDISYQQEEPRRPCESCLIKLSQENKCYPLPYSLRSLYTSNNGLFCMLLEAFCGSNLSLKTVHAADLYSFNCLQSFWKALRNLKTLEELDLSGNFIKEIPTDAFSEQKYIKRLLLVRNYLLEISFDCEHLTALQDIDLRNNSIVSATETFTASIERPAYNITINLDNNRLICDCKRTEFVAWLHATTFIHQKDRLSCTYSNGSELSLSRVSEIHDRLQNGCIAMEVTLGCIGVFILQHLILIIIALSCHNRWKLNYLLAVGRRTLNPYHPLEGAAIEMEYDVYISYDRDYKVTPNEDLHAFVANKLYPGLRQRGFRVLIRDELDIGKRLYEVISKAVRKCDKVLVLLSKEYCSDYWNVFEFNMAAMEGIYTKRQVVIPIALENVDLADLHGEVHAFLKDQSIPAYTKNSHITEQDFIDYVSKLIRDNRPFD